MDVSQQDVSTVCRRLKATLRDVFGYDDFRPGQEKAATALLRKRFE